MPYIKINEIDNTSINVNLQTITDVVYIKGFTGNILGKDEKDIPQEPVYVDSLTAFETYFGNEPLTASGTIKINESDTVYLYDADGDKERSYIYAKELVKAGLPVIYDAIVIKDKNTFDETDIQNFYSSITTSLEDIRDLGEYSPKYLTLGGYPSIHFSNVSDAASLIEAAADRGDCVALPDFARDITLDKMYASVQALVGICKKNEESYASYGAVFTPWFAYDNTLYTNTESANDDLSIMPASFAYLLGLAKSIKSNANWLAVAGVARGQVNSFIDKLDLKERLSNTIADSFQPYDKTTFGEVYVGDNAKPTKENGITAINAITNIKPYGLTIWGNRTLRDNYLVSNKIDETIPDKVFDTADSVLTATSFLNIRNMVSDVKKIAYTAAKSLIFEQNTDVLWINFKAKVTPLLDKLLSGSGVSNYKIIKEPTTNKTKIKAKIILYPVYAVEQFEIDIILRDEDVEII